MEKKLQIREINDIQGNKYKVYDIMVKSKFGLWKSVATFDDLGRDPQDVIQEIIRWNANIHVEDLTN